jgi:hypothetical protein
MTLNTVGLAMAKLPSLEPCRKGYDSTITDQQAHQTSRVHCMTTVSELRSKQPLERLEWAT